MAHFITAHYPHPQPNPDVHPWHIYLQEQFEDIARRVRVGDRVLFYESKHHPRMADGKPRPGGAEGIVRLGTVNDAARLRPSGLALAEYADGTTANWKWGISTDPKTLERGFVSRADLNDLMGYRPGYNLRGFGDQHSGLKAIDEAPFDRLVKLFRRRR